MKITRKFLVILFHLKIIIVTVKIVTIYKKKRFKHLLMKFWITHWFPKPRENNQGYFQVQIWIIISKLNRKTRMEIKINRKKLKILDLFQIQKQINQCLSQRKQGAKLSHLIKLKIHRDKNPLLENKFHLIRTNPLLRNPKLVL